MVRRLSAILMCWVMGAQQPPADTPTFTATTTLVVVTVFVRGKDGKPVPNLRREDFRILENGKPQTISVFEFENIGGTEAVGAAAVVTEERPVAAANPANAPAPFSGRQRYRDRRLLVLFFDWSSLGTAEQVLAKEAAEKFVREEMQPSDLVAIMSFGSALKVNQEFTADKDQLVTTIRRFQTGQSSELAGMASTDVDTAADAAFSVDDTEFNVFNTDRKLGALEDAAAKLSALPEKKAMIYFSAGVGRTGAENQSQLQATINAAVRANVSFYPVDVRGLQATPPGGDASTASPRGTGIYTGQTQSRQREQMTGEQDTLFALASDTGGKALLDENNLVLGVKQAQEELQQYYILGYYSTDERKDGQFRKVDVKLAPGLQAKLDYRSGYFAEKDFKAFNRYDKEKQLQDALLLGDPVTDLPMAVEVDYFRMEGDRYFVPVAVKLPGSAIPLAKKGSAETTQFDFIGQVRDDKGAIAASVRDNITIKLRDKDAGTLSGRSLLYDTGFTLVAGQYKLKMLVRENQTGRMGTFETSFRVKNLGAEKAALRLSPAVWSSQKQPYTENVGAADKRDKRLRKHPLVVNDQKILPSVTRAFRNGQTVFVYAEAYDPGQLNETGPPALSASVALYKDRKKVAESRPAAVRAFAEGRKNTASVLLELPLKDLPEGEYVGQLTVVDPVSKKFETSRTPVVILPAAQNGQRGSD